MALLEVDDLRVAFETEDGLVRAVDGVSLTLERGQALAIVGESGSGKSVAGLTLLGLTRGPRTRIDGAARLEGLDLLRAGGAQLRRLRGARIAMVFQDPLSALHPHFRVGAQIVEALRAHRDVSRAQARARAVELLGLVGAPDPRRLVDAYPHELSGGLRQRAMIAMALVAEPAVLIADEPTTALDVTVQAQILGLLERLRVELEMGLVLITHDLGVVAEVATDVAVMYAGRIVEQGATTALFDEPEHPYTWGLLGAIPRLDAPRERELTTIPGRPPSPIARPGGCAFHPRCPYARPAHARVDPRLEAVREGAGHEVACLLAPPTRRALWGELARGAAPAAALATVGAAADGDEDAR